MHLYFSYNLLLFKTQWNHRKFSGNVLNLLESLRIHLFFASICWIKRSMFPFHTITKRSFLLSKNNLVLNTHQKEDHLLGKCLPMHIKFQMNKLSWLTQENKNKIQNQKIFGRNRASSQVSEKIMWIKQKRKETTKKSRK